jgi:hypothetical protein
VVAGGAESEKALWPLLKWQRLRFSLVKSDGSPRHTEHPLAVFDAMVRQAQPDVSPAAVILRTPGQSSGAMALRPGSRFALELLIIRGDEQTMKTFVSTFRERLFAFADDGDILIDDVAFAPRGLPDSEEVCLWFRTPLPVRSDKGRLRLGAAD